MSGQTIEDVYERYEFEDILESARMNAGTDWDEEFVKDMKARYDQWGMRAFLSDAQQEQLERIAGED